MKVLMVFRPPRPGGYSIENIFEYVKCSLSDKAEIECFVMDGSRSILWNMLQLSSIKADVYHVTGDCNFMTLVLPRNRTVLTVHDIGHYERTLTGIKKWIYGLVWWVIPLWHVKNITVVSEFTGNRLQKVFGVDGSKLRVIYNPLFPGFYAKENLDINKPPRILQIGRGENKNLETLIEAVKDFNCHLVLVNRLSQRQENLLKEYRISYEVHESVSLGEVQELYRSCDVLYFASWYEGFGIPIIEAYATGLPVITSNCASMPEVANGTAWLVEPGNAEQVRDALSSILGDEKLRTERVRQGLANAEKFMLSNIAMSYFRLYEKIRGNG